MEDDLDAVSRGEREWVPLLEEFWKPFSKLVEHTETNVTREQASQARVLGTDPASGRPDERADGPLRRVRADRHEGRRGQAEVRGPASRPEDGHDHARRRARSVQAAARARGDARRRARVREHRPLRAVRSLRVEVRVDTRRRSVHDHARARAAVDRREEDRRREQADPRFPRRRHPGAERPLRAVRHRQEEEREDSEGSRAERAHARGMPGVARGGARAARTRHAPRQGRPHPRPRTRSPPHYAQPQPRPRRRRRRKRRRPRASRPARARTLRRPSMPRRAGEGGGSADAGDGEAVGSETPDA